MKIYGTRRKETGRIKILSRVVYVSSTNIYYNQCLNVLLQIVYIKMSHENCDLRTKKQNIMKKKGPSFHF
jgi:hypothetical protein